MIITDTFYAVECEVCKEVAENYDGMSFWADEDTAIQNARDRDWKRVKGNDYCRKCWDGDLKKAWEAKVDEMVFALGKRIGNNKVYFDDYYEDEFTPEQAISAAVRETVI